MPRQTIIKTENLSIGYHNKKALTVIASDINLEFQEGKLITLIGANGIGKSTLLRTLTGIRPPLSGTVILSDAPIADYSAAALAKKLSVVLTDALPPSNLTVFELVALGRQPYTNWIGSLTSEDVAKVNEALELVGIKELSEKKHFEISDGQLQKVLVARALAQDTPLIILDEPTTHLDLLHKAELFLLLKKLTKKSNKTILFSTHDIDLAIQLSDEMVVMTKGKIVSGTPERLVSEGVFDTIFPRESIIFDQKNAKFIFKDI